MIKWRRRRRSVSIATECACHRVSDQSYCEWIRHCGYRGWR